VQDMQAVVVTA